MRLRAYVSEGGTSSSVDPGDDVSVPSVNSSVWENNAADDVAADVETLVLTYTVLATKMFMDEVSVTGTGNAVFRIYLNGVKKETVRVNQPNDVRTARFPPQRLEVGDVVDVKVTHYQAGKLFRFEATLKGHR